MSRTRLLSVTGGAVVLLMILSACGSSESSETSDEAPSSAASSTPPPPTEPASFDMVIVVTSTPSDSSMGADFAGELCYDEAVAGSSIAVRDENGTIVGTGGIADNTSRGAAAGTCDYDTTIRDVPSGSAFYEIDFGRLGSTTVDAENAKAGVQLTFG